MALFDKLRNAFSKQCMLIGDQEFELALSSRNPVGVFRLHWSLHKIS